MEWTYTRWFTALGMTVNGDLREKEGDCKECHGMHHHIITTVLAGGAFPHIDIPYISFHSLPIQNFDSTWVKVSRFTEKRQVLLMA